MRSLHVAFSAFIQDYDMWPPAPQDDGDDDSAVVSSEEHWMKFIDPYVDTRKVWVCPILERGRLATPTGTLLKMHYIPTQFDANRQSPFRWPTQPWLIEMSDAHGSGPLILFPDGSIQGLQDILKKKKS